MKGLFSAVKGILAKLKSARAAGQGSPIPPRPSGPRGSRPMAEKIAEITGQGRASGPRLTALPPELTAGPVVEFVQPKHEEAEKVRSNVTQVGAVEDIENFLYFGEWFNVTSTNVMRMRYEPAEVSGLAQPPPAGTMPPGGAPGPSSGGRLIVQFLQHGSTYEYSGITVEVAHDFAMAASKGKWVWDHLRSAGINYLFIGSNDGHVPERTNPGSRKSQRRLGRTLVQRRAKAMRTPRFGKVKVRKSLSEIVRRISKQRAGRA